MRNKAHMYQVKIAESVFDMAHNNYHVINELYIPDLNISINVFNDGLNIFEPDIDRYKKAKKVGKAITISEDLATNIIDFIETKKKLDIIKDLFR
jgi:hypothetical protein